MAQRTMDKRYRALKSKSKKTCDKNVSPIKENSTAGTAMDEKALSNVTYNSTPFLVPSE